MHPILTWLEANPTKHPSYVILFPRIPTRFYDQSSGSATIASMVWSSIETDPEEIVIELADGRQTSSTCPSSFTTTF